jgi:hypothetical protein
MVLKQLDDDTVVCSCVQRRSFSCLKHAVLSNREVWFGECCLLPITTATVTVIIIIITINPSRVVSLEEYSQAYFISSANGCSTRSGSLCCGGKQLEAGNQLCIWLPEGASKSGGNMLEIQLQIKRSIVQQVGFYCLWNWAVFTENSRGSP